MMLACRGAPKDPQARLSQEIDRELRHYSKKESGIIKLLLLGTGESGKTTIIKQMKIIHINGFSNEEKIEKIAAVRQNIHESIYSIVSSLSKIAPPLFITNEGVKQSEKYILNLGPNELEEYTDEYYDHVKTLWMDEVVQEAFKRSNEYQLIDSAQHFLERIDEIRQPTYMPTAQDILVCRIETKAISKIEFSVKVPKTYGGGTANFWMFDVGGQRGHRKKWISVFDGIQAILFLIASSDFDQTLREDATKNRLKESFQIFDDIFWSRYVRDAGMLVFLNKQDLLKKKIEDGKKLEKYFPEYTKYTVPNKSADSEYDRAKLFMRQKIIDISKRKRNELRTVMPGLVVEAQVEERDVYIHYTVATDTKNIKLVFEDVHDLIIRINTQKIYSH